MNRFLLLLPVTLVLGCGQPAAPRHEGDQISSEVVAANGVIEGARREVELRPEVGGMLTRLHVRENQPVQAGALLFEVGNEAQSAQVELARAELEAARVDAEQAESDWRRSTRLVARSAMSMESYENDKFRRARCEARLTEARARLKLAEAELSKTRVVAPFAGQVLQVFVESGASVGPSSPRPVLRLADLSRRRVRAFIEELDMARVQPGQRAIITVDGMPGREFPGTAAERASRMGKTSVSGDSPDE
ncbi:MAG: efflux RND transporter periplasmic adaptor subunit, partial [Gemmataceae bacterium]